MEETSQRALRELQTQAEIYHRFKEEPAEFLEHLYELSDEELGESKRYQREFATRTLDGVKQISPVVFLRYVVVDRIERGEDVTLDDLDEIQTRIDEKDLEYFSEHASFLDLIEAQRERQASAFRSWTPFSLLFGIDYRLRAKAVRGRLKRVAEDMRSKVELPNSDQHLAGFDWNQNFGTDNCWLAFYPRDRKGHQNAYQIFLGIAPKGYEYGLIGGSRLSGADERMRDTEDMAAGTLDSEAIVKALSEKLPDYHRLNRSVAGEPRASGTPHPETDHALNTILYGPPGTGKTYAARRRAVDIIEGGAAEMTESEIGEQFRVLVDKRRIEFVTFHPSYSYEEFVEGLRYHPDEKIPLPEDGVFKEVVHRAINPHQPEHVPEGADIWKISLGRSGEPGIFEHCMANNEIAIGWFEDTDLQEYDPEGLHALFEEHDRGNESNNYNSVNYFVNEMKEGDYVLVLKNSKQIRAIGRVTGDYQYRPGGIRYNHTRPVEWLDDRVHRIYEMNGSKNIGMPTVYRLGRIRLEDVIDLLPETPSEDPKPYVLIIDEINRGNLSRIFGELMTLLEPDKRRGARNEMSVRLPYSQKSFTVPKNLHIIGTMNTADRSIALLDVALRRRFTFEEMMPEVDVVRDVLSAELEQEDSETELTTEQIELICFVFDTLNKRVTVCLDRDHQIGHSYFLDIESMADLHDVLYTQVFPLLQEYFYDDKTQLTRLLGEYEEGEGGFIRSLEEEYETAWASGIHPEREMPWTVHEYRVGQLEEALRRTFVNVRHE